MIDSRLHGTLKVARDEDNEPRNLPKVEIDFLIEPISISGIQARAPLTATEATFANDGDKTTLGLLREAEFL